MFNKRSIGKIDYLIFVLIFSCEHESNLDYDKMKRQLLRIKNSNYPKIPNSIEQIRHAIESKDVWENFGFNSDKSHQLYFGTVVRVRFSFIVFASMKVIQMIDSHIPVGRRKYLLDGTFQIVPRIFYQLIVINIEYHNQVR